ncbi:MAG TPA: peptidoglycan DD-metalloendopeptidase family protein [Flavobacteriaceae bacterium]|nr:peptidoglycan DD-metalloendopeptidase family protein [Flavobacteriaceae bacterium]
MKKLITLFALFILIGCSNNTEKTESTDTTNDEQSRIVYKYGFKIDDFKVINDTINYGENFTEILTKYNIDYPRALEIITNVKDTFNVSRIKAGKPYTVLASKDSLSKAEVIIYKDSKIQYTVLDFKDSIVNAYKVNRPVKRVIKTASGVITTSLSESLSSQGFSSYLTYLMAEDIYPWTIDFSRLYKNDKYKIIYEQLFINDTVPVGIGKIKAAYFEHGSKPYYAFRYMADSTKGIIDYYNSEAEPLRRQFLKMPVKFSRISSRYNLRRRIAYYGNRIRPHKGTDFAAPIGTPIMATANGKVIASRYRGGNGNYVKIRHNATYTTQYLHMQKRKVKVGDYVKQGDIIGTIGMTGNTSGPHVCYRFWKNGRQVDPLRQKLPAAEPMKKDLVPAYLEFIKPLKAKLDAIPLNKQVEETEINLAK